MVGKDIRKKVWRESKEKTQSEDRKRISGKGLGDMVMKITLITLKYLITLKKKRARWRG